MAAVGVKKKNSFPRVRRFSYQPPERLEEAEKRFILDSVPFGRLVNDETWRTNPSLNFGIPLYSPLNDKNCRSFYQSKGLPKGVMDSFEKKGCENESTAVSASDKFIKSSSAIQYLDNRKKMGAGYTCKIYGGHLGVPTAPPFQGYNGEGGYRRNTPDLRAKPSVFKYNDSFEYPRRHGVHSAPAKIQLFRARSVKAYSSQS